MRWCYQLVVLIIYSTTMYHHLELQVFDHLRHEITEKAGVVLTYEMPITVGRKYSADILIYHEDEHIALVEVKKPLTPENIGNAEVNLKRLALSQGYLYAIITDDENCRLWEAKDGLAGEFRYVTLAEIIDVFKSIKPHIDDVESKRPHARDFRTEVSRLADKYLAEDNDRISRIKAFVTSCKDADFEVKGGKLRFSDIKKENEFFEQLIESFCGDTVYRYTSLDSLFLTLNTGNQGMCCLVGMNDKSEVYYADRYLDRESGKTAYDRNKENSFFILSCVEDKPEENLMMWRLYGDNTKGVRIKYTPKAMPDGFRFAKIYYGSDIKTHPGLDLIKQIQEIKFGSITFRFRHFDYWKHFFKPYDYKMENEVRLLYETTASNPPKITDWIKGGEFSILIPLALFDEKSFPLDIEEIKIGPNMSARETNLLQIRQLVKDKTILPISNDVDKNVSVSRIEHYRS